MSRVINRDGLPAIISGQLRPYPWGGSHAITGQGMGSQASGRDELAAEISTMQPGHVADMMIQLDAKAHRRLMLGVFVGAFGFWAARKFF